MRRLTATSVYAFTFLILVASPAHALKALVATIALGEVQVVGVGKKNANISWEGNVVTQSNKLGAFKFSTADLPIDCVGDLSDSVSLIPVVINGCTTEQVSGGVLKTGQTTSQATGDDGDFQAGTAVPNPRFTDNGDGTVTDNLTGLTWLKDASCLGAQTWANALAAANALADGNVACGLSDGSVAGDWRLPNRNELSSLLDLGTSNPALPAVNPFINFQTVNYVSSTTWADNSGSAWLVHFGLGFVGAGGKAFGGSVTAVRGGL